LAVPLEGVAGVVGVLALYRSGHDAFSRDQLRILQAISSKLSVSIDNALRFRQAETTATIDYLTKLPNARSLFLHLDAEVSRARRKGTSLAVLVCDLDGFKQVNDRFGHLTGNRLLTAVATGLSQACREYDYVARMGGDEFVIVLPDCSPAVVEKKLAALSAVVEAAGFEVSGEKIVAMSAGPAFFPDDAPDPEGLLAIADRAMYQAKNAKKRLAAAPSRQTEDDLATEGLAALARRIGTLATEVPANGS
jgi:diguanylate cyclase (GGDEF)-like protein